MDSDRCRSGLPERGAGRCGGRTAVAPRAPCPTTTVAVPYALPSRRWARSRQSMASGLALLLLRLCGLSRPSFPSDLVLARSLPCASLIFSAAFEWSLQIEREGERERKRERERERESMGVASRPGRLALGHRGSTPQKPPRAVLRVWAECQWREPRAFLLPARVQERPAAPWPPPRGSDR